MKSVITLPAGLFLATVLFACTDEPAQSPVPVAQLYAKVKSSDRTAQNLDNPYDDIGYAYTTLLDSYKTGNYNPTGFSDLLTIANILQPATGSPLGNTETQVLLGECINNPQSKLAALLQQSSLSPAARAILSDLVTNYEKLADEPFSEAYETITAIESTTGSDTGLQGDELRIVYTVTAMTRYSLYHSCCEDTDWEKSVGNIVAAVAGSLESSNRALQYSLITSIAGLEQIQIYN